jgi:acetyl-CoA carboxylase biotin carboxyl carrier protein
LEIKELKKLVEILKDSEVTDFEMEKEGTRIKISRSGGNVIFQQAPVGGISNEYQVQSFPTTPSPQHVQQNVATGDTSAPIETSETKPVKEDETLQGAHIISSPIVGTFYRKPNPNAEPYVNMGDKVKPGQTLCIVEAMKLMNEITSEVGGEIIKIFVEDAQPVEYGEPLFAIKTM